MKYIICAGVMALAIICTVIFAGMAEEYRGYRAVGGEYVPLVIAPVACVYILNRRKKP